MARRRRWLWVAAVALAAGCSIAPRDFLDLTHPAPLVRARSASLGRKMPGSVVVPALIARLDDADPVVRLTAHEELRRQTGQDFGFVPWADPPERAAAVSRWKAWWSGREAGLAKLPPLP
jgi:hypothetical protein